MERRERTGLGEHTSHSAISLCQCYKKLCTSRILAGVIRAILHGNHTCRLGGTFDSGAI